MDALNVDFLVIGSGLAGLSYALELADHGQVAVVTKGEILESNTQWAQGGIAAAVGEADSWRLHEQDTLIAGAGLCDPAAVRYLVSHAPSAIDWLIRKGAKFDLNDSQNLALGMEGGHSRKRIVHHQDRTGWEVERAIVESVKNHPSITVYEHAFVTTLLMNDGRCVGARVMVETVGERDLLARSVMLATGGAGKLYTHTTNPSVATADGIALAASAGATIENMEFMQFHPTTLYHPQMRAFLISEAVRGAGGTLRNHNGRRFMYDYDDRLELAPRDVVARAIESEIKKHDSWCVYLDVTHLHKEDIVAEFPTIYQRLASIGLEIEKEWIPVVPAQHYSCGGVKTDLSGQTSIPGLFASGEVACTGVHGANRLASNSLLEALVFSRAAASTNLESNPVAPSGTFTTTLPMHSIAEADAVHIRRTMQRTMTEYVGIVRTFKGLREAEAKLADLKAEYADHNPAPFSRYSLETWNLLIAAEHVVKGALLRDQNIGLHFNSDLVERAGSASVPKQRATAK